MYKSPIQVLRLIAILVMVLVTCSCTSEMKKSRYLSRAERYFKAGEYDQAKIEYLKVLQIDSGNAVAYARCGAMWADEGAPLRAAAFLLKARELAPEDLDNRYKLALVYLQVGQATDRLLLLWRRRPSLRRKTRRQNRSCRNSRSKTTLTLKWLTQRWRSVKETWPTPKRH